jgi:hypothetical protein
MAGSADTSLPHKSLGGRCDLFFYHRLNGLFFFDVWDIFTVLSIDSSENGCKKPMRNFSPAQFA